MYEAWVIANKSELHRLSELYLHGRDIGSVFAGYRKADNLPVAIKHIPKDKVFWENKIILKQLVDGALELEKNNIFHRDIKVENVLIETGSDVPHVWLIDFGLSCFVQEGSLFNVFQGTAAHVPPEWCSYRSYSAGPTTVWQLGVLLYESLHRQFETPEFLSNKLKNQQEALKMLPEFLEKLSEESSQATSKYLDLSFMKNVLQIRYSLLQCISKRFVQVAIKCIPKDKLFWEHKAHPQTGTLISSTGSTTVATGSGPFENLHRN